MKSWASTKFSICRFFAAYQKAATSSSNLAKTRADRHRTFISSRSAASRPCCRSGSMEWPWSSGLFEPGWFYRLLVSSVVGEQVLLWVKVPFMWSNSDLERRVFLVIRRFWCILLKVAEFRQVAAFRSGVSKLFEWRVITIYLVVSQQIGLFVV